jgi:hypothetical protein
MEISLTPIEQPEGYAMAKPLRLKSSWLRVPSGLVVAVSGPMLAGCATFVTPDAYPELEPASTRSAVLVAELRRGRDLPSFPGCAEPQVICMDPAPYWVHARVKSVVFGEPLKSRNLAISTTSHYGMEMTIADRGPQLLHVAHDDHAYVMPRYAHASLSTRLDGSLDLVLWSADPVPWLPCEAIALAEPIQVTHFARMPLRSPDSFRSEELQPGNGFLRMTPDGVEPLLAIPVEKLARYLGARFRGVSLPWCAGKDH